MIKFNKIILANGLRIIVHEDRSTPLVTMNIMYDVGARDEHPDKTGFAHLFEHLMFGGSLNIPEYDKPLQKAGGENNAFTNNDITNYYCTLPAVNLETAFWLESDRMLSLGFTPKSLDVQRNVVTEEFRQVYLNQPYGDAWLLLRPLAYKVHPYQWSTIGKEISHIQNAQMSDVKAFYERYYNPCNAVMVISGNTNLAEVEKLAGKWFAPIPNHNGRNNRKLPQEPPQSEKRSLKVDRTVPFDAIYKAYHMCARLDNEYYATDLISDILSNGNSSRFYQQLIKNKKLFSEINAFISGDIENGLFIITGKLTKGVSMETAEEAIDKEISQLINQPVQEEELQKVKNKVESSLIFSEMSILNRAINLAYYEVLGNADMINDITGYYDAVKSDEIRSLSKSILAENNSSTLYYYSSQ